MFQQECLFLLKQNNFSLTDDQDEKPDNLTDAGYDELAHGISLALENEWELAIENNPDLPDGQVNQSVGQTYNPQTSSYSVTKTVSWSWR